MEINKHTMVAKGISILFYYLRAFSRKIAHNSRSRSATAIIDPICSYNKRTTHAGDKVRQQQSTVARCNIITIDVPKIAEEVLIGLLVRITVTFLFIGIVIALVNHVCKVYVHMPVKGACQTRQSYCQQTEEHTKSTEVETYSEKRRR